MFVKYLTACAAFVSLSACDEPLAATRNIADFNQAYATYGDLLSSPSSAAPSGGGTFKGKITSNARIDDLNVYKILGDMAMDIDFERSGVNVSGAITNINLFDLRSVTGDQRMTNGNGENGSLTIVGLRTGSSIRANATGRLGAVLPDVNGDSTSLETSADINLNMLGNVRTTNNVSDTVLGTFNNIGRASDTNGMIVQTSGGEFYGMN